MTSTVFLQPKSGKQSGLLTNNQIMPKNYRITSEGIKINVAVLPAAWHEIQELVEKVIKHHGLSYGVRVYCYTIQIQDWFIDRLKIEILDVDLKPFGLLEYDTEKHSGNNNPDVFLFRWHSSTITDIPGEDITLEDHIKRVLAHTFKPINRKETLPMKK